MKKMFLILLTLINLTAFAQVELVSGGSANAYTLAFPGVFSYSNGISFTFKANFANTAAATINVNGLGAKAIKKEASSDLAANDIKSGQVVTLVYDGTNFQITSGLGNAPGGGGSSGWGLSGNSVSATDFLGTTNTQSLVFKVNGVEAGRIAYSAGNSNTSLGVGSFSSNVSSFGNSAFGNGAMSNNTYGNYNVAVGDYAMWLNATGFNNVAVGRNSGVGASNPNNATAIGANAAATFENSTAIGANALAQQENSMVLGSINGVNSATASTKVGIGTTTPSATLHVNGTFRLQGNGAAAGKVLTSDANGNATWQSIGGGGGPSNAWDLTGNSGTNPATDYLGTSDFQPLVFRVNNQFAGMLNPSTTNTSFGYASYPGVSGNNNTAVGTLSMLVNSGDYNSALGAATLNSNTSGSYNTAIGSNALNLNTDGSENVAIGVAALNNNTSGTNNVAIGVQALNDAQTGTNNVAVGHHALQQTTDPASFNIAIGGDALKMTQTNNSIAIGYRALAGNNIGVNNVAIGHESISSNTSGANNTGVGFETLEYADGSANTAVGARAIANLLTGNFNTALGSNALVNQYYGSGNTAIGNEAMILLDNGDYNTALGHGTDVGVSSTYSTAIGAFAQADNDYTIILGAVNGFNGYTGPGIKVGIGTTTPSTTLHVVTTAGAGTGFRLVDGSQGANKVLTSDANGNATWQASGGGGGGSGWNLTGNSGTDSTVNFVGTTDAQPLVFKTNTSSDGYGMKLTTDGALEFSNLSGSSIFIGKGAPASENFTRTTIVGDFAMHNIDLSDNSEDHTAIGYGALYNFVDGSSDYSNTAVGSNAAYNLSNGSYNTALGAYSMAAATEGYRNVAVGFSALRNVQSSDNTAIGTDALRENTSGNNNTAIGSGALFSNTSGSLNVAIGAEAMSNNNSGIRNVAIGYQALQLTAADASYNVAVGLEALKNTQTGFQTAVGYRALIENTFGTGNAALGAYALANNTGGSGNVAIGEEALSSHGFGDNNTALGYRALAGDVFGNSNVAIGKECLAFNQGGGFNTVVGTGAASQSFNGNHNVILGYSALTLADGSGVTILGSQALIGVNTAQNTTVIGASTFYDGDDAVRLGNSLVTTVEGPVAYTVASDARFKTNVSSTDVKGLDFITKLRPVNYNFDTRKYEEFISKNLPDSIRRKRLAQDFTKSTAIRQTGFIAQEVEKAAKETGYDFSSGLHTPKTENEYYTVAYSQFVVPLVKAVQELNQKIEKLEKENAALKAEKESSVIGYKATYSKTTPITADDLQNQINDLRKQIEQLSKNK